MVAGTLRVAHEAAAGHAANVLIGDGQRPLDSVAVHSQVPRRGIDNEHPLLVVRHKFPPAPSRARYPLKIEELAMAG